MTSADKQLYEDIGAIKKGIGGLEAQTEALGKKVDLLNGQAITKEECHGRSSRIYDKIDEIKDALKLDDSRPWFLKIGKYAGATIAVLALLGMLGGSGLMLSRFIVKVERSLEATRKLDDRRGKRFDRRLKDLDRRYAEPAVAPLSLPMTPSAGRGPHRQ